jgi:hypothetical protein
MKSAAVGWSEMARYNKGGDKNPKYKNPGIFLIFCMTVVWGRKTRQPILGLATHF